MYIIVSENSQITQEYLRQIPDANPPSSDFLTDPVVLRIIQDGVFTNIKTHKAAVLTTHDAGARLLLNQ